MTRRDMSKPRKNATPYNNKGREMYAESVDESTASENLSLDSRSDSDDSEFDRNNNLSLPSPLLGYQDASPPWNLGGETSGDTSSDDAMMASVRDITSDSQYGSAGRASSEDILSQDDDLSARETDSDEDSIKQLKERLYSEDRRMEHKRRTWNANENNNSNRKRLRSRGSRGSRDIENNNNNGWKGRSRSVQLSSVRAGKGMYKGRDLKQYVGRMISKDGSTNVRVKQHGKLDTLSRFVKDIYTTLVDLSTPWVLLLTALVYIGHWLIFGMIYWLFAHSNGDISDVANPNVTSEQCVSNVHDFVSAFLFSMESETTIGYGSRSMNPLCKGAVTTLVIQCVISAIFDTWVIGMCYAKFSSPELRLKTFLYAKNAVICTRDGKKCLLVRVANLRKSLLTGVSCRARVITVRAPQHKELIEGHQYVLEQKELEFQNANCAVLTAPVEYCHIIDKDSPLFTIPEKYLAAEQNWFEIVVILTGSVESTGMTLNAQTSYLSSEIKYKHRYEPIISVNEDKGRYNVDFKNFHNTTPEPTAYSGLESSVRIKSPESRIDVLPEEDEDDVSDDVFENRRSPEIGYNPISKQYVY